MGVGKVIVPKNAIVPLRRGHPWLYKDVLVHEEPGTPVVLESGDGQRLGWGLADKGDITVRVMDVSVPKQFDVPRVIKDRIRRADALRTRLFSDGTDTYRVVNGAGDGLPGIVVDRYGYVAVVRLYSEAWEKWIWDIAEAVEGLFWATSVVRKLGVERVDGRQGLEGLAGDDPPEILVVQEGAMQLLVRPGYGQKTGMFLDQREHRALVGRWASGRLVANLFSYHGGFSVSAALGGAARVTSVDVAPEAIEDAKENFRLNGIDPEEHEFIVADAFAWRPQGKIDFLIVDPPSLARGKRSQGAAKSAYRKLHRNLAPHISRDGLLGTASCTSRMSPEEWRKAVEEGVSGSGLWSWLWTSATPPDHPVAAWHDEARYLKFGLLRRR